MSAVAKELSGLVADNESKLAPTLDRLNSVAAMLEKNRDNIAKALPGLKKYEFTSGEAVSNGFYYNAFVPNLAIPELIQPFFDYYFGFRRGRPEHAAGPVPLAAQRHSGGIAMTAESGWRRRCSWSGLIVAAAAFLVRETFFRPQTITAYFTSATGIYPG